MAWIVLAGTLAAFGFLCAVWVAVGWLLPGGKDGFAVCVCTPPMKELSTIHRWRWLRSLGLVRCPITVVAKDLDEAQMQELCRAAKDMDICTEEEFYNRLKMESIEIDGTGIGDPAGRDRRSCISEL